MEWTGNLLMLRDRLKGPNFFNSSKPGGLFVHRQVYLLEIRRYAGKMQCLSVPLWPKGLLQPIVTGCRWVEAGLGQLF